MRYLKVRSYYVDVHAEPEYFSVYLESSEKEEIGGFRICIEEETILGQREDKETGLLTV